MKNRELLPVGAKPAPGDLAYVQGFINLLRFISIRDDIDKTQYLKRWLIKHGLISPAIKIGAAELKTAFAFHTAMRGLLRANRGEKLNKEMIKILNRLIRRVNLTVTFRADGTFLFGPTAKGFEKALGVMLAIVIKSMDNGSWARLKACINDRCQWVFYDSSKNNSGRWCLMSACGARSKARTYRRRKSTNK